MLGLLKSTSKPQKFSRHLKSNSICRSFGKSGSQYDFSKEDMGRLKEKAQELEAIRDGMKKKVNPKATNMLGRYASSQ